MRSLFFALALALGGSAGGCADPPRPVASEDAFADLDAGSSVDGPGVATDAPGACCPASPSPTCECSFRPGGWSYGEPCRTVCDFFGGTTATDSHGCTVWVEDRCRRCLLFDASLCADAGTSP